MNKFNINNIIEKGLKIEYCGYYNVKTLKINDEIKLTKDILNCLYNSIIVSLTEIQKQILANVNINDITINKTRECIEHTNIKIYSLWKLYIPLKNNKNKKDGMRIIATFDYKNNKWLLHLIYQKKSFGDNDDLYIKKQILAIKKDLKKLF